MASKETDSGSENNLTITFPSNTSLKSLSTKLLDYRQGEYWNMIGY